MARWSPRTTTACGMGNRPLLTDRGEPGRDPAQLQRGDPGVPWVEKESATVISCSAPADAPRSSDVMPTGRGLLVDGGASRGNLLSGEADETILTVAGWRPRSGPTPAIALPRQRVQRHPGTGPVHLGGAPEWMAAIRAIRRDVRRAAIEAGSTRCRRSDVRDRARPDRLQGVDRHDARMSRGVRHLLQLRRGRAPFRASSAPTRWRRCASSTSSSVGSSGRVATRQAVRDRRPLRPRPDTGRDLQAAKRLRARRAGCALTQRR